MAISNKVDVNLDISDEVKKYLYFTTNGDEFLKKKLEEDLKLTTPQLSRLSEDAYLYYEPDFEKFKLIRGDKNLKIRLGFNIKYSLLNFYGDGTVIDIINQDTNDLLLNSTMFHNNNMDRIYAGPIHLEDVKLLNEENIYLNNFDALVLDINNPNNYNFNYDINRISGINLHDYLIDGFDHHNMKKLFVSLSILDRVSGGDYYDLYRHLKDLINVTKIHKMFILDNSLQETMSFFLKNGTFKTVKSTEFVISSFVTIFYLAQKIEQSDTLKILFDLLVKHINQMCSPHTESEIKSHVLRPLIKNINSKLYQPIS